MTTCLGLAQMFLMTLDFDTCSHYVRICFDIYIHVCIIYLLCQCCFCKKLRDKWRGVNFEIENFRICLHPFLTSKQNDSRSCTGHLVFHLEVLTEGAMGRSGHFKWIVIYSFQDDLSAASLAIFSIQTLHHKVDKN